MGDQAKIGFSLHSYQQGKGDPLLCLHGHPGSGRSMGVFLDHFSDRFQVIAPDLRGYGRSQTRQAFQMEDHLTDLTALLDRQNAAKSLVLGWSLGGIFALELALRHPDRIRGLILIATAARPWSDHPKVSWQDNVFTAIAGLINLAKPGWPWNIEQFGKRSLFRYLIQQHRPDVYQYLAQEAAYAYLKTSRSATQALTTAIQQGYNRVPDLQQISCPALMLIGAADRHIAPVASRETAKAMKDCEWEEFPQTAHLLPWECPDLLLARIDRWLLEKTS